MPLDTILCLDTSSSMAGRGMRELQKAANVFIDGVEETARESSLKENVAIVEFGKNTRIVQPLTTNYSLLRVAAHRLEAGGTTPMFNGLMLAMKEILTNGGIVRVLGRPLTPRIILMTDEKPTDPDSDHETEDAKKEVLSAAASFGPGWEEAGLPHPIPIVCVGCGTCDPAMLASIAKLTNGMFVVVDNMSEISGFFRRQGLLIRFAAQFASDMKSMRNELVLRRFLQKRGEAVAEEELRGLMTLLVAMMGLEALAEAASESDQRGPDLTTDCCCRLL